LPVVTNDLSLICHCEGFSPWQSQKDGIPCVSVDFPTILRISENVSESSGSSEKRFKSKIVPSSVCIDFSEVYDVVDNMSTTSSGRLSALRWGRGGERRERKGERDRLKMRSPREHRRELH
jgi:hypothetical protein